MSKKYVVLSLWHEPGTKECPSPMCPKQLIECLNICDNYDKAMREVYEYILEEELDTMNDYLFDEKLSEASIKEIISDMDEDYAEYLSKILKVKKDEKYIGSDDSYEWIREYSWFTEYKDDDKPNTVHKRYHKRVTNIRIVKMEVNNESN